MCMHAHKHYTWGKVGKGLEHTHTLFPFQDFPRIEWERVLSQQGVHAHTHPDKLYLFQNFPGVEWEGVLSQANLLVSMLQLDLTGRIHDNVTICILYHRVLHHAIVTWWHHDHLLRPKHHPGNHRVVMNFISHTHPHTHLHLHTHTCTCTHTHTHTHT